MLRIGVRRYSGRQEGDFPVLVRRSRISQVQDLHNVPDTQDKIHKLKPHHVRSLVRGSSGSSGPSGPVGTGKGLGVPSVEQMEPLHERLAKVDNPFVQSESDMTKKFYKQYFSQSSTTSAPVQSETPSDDTPPKTRSRLVSPNKYWGVSEYTRPNDLQQISSTSEYIRILINEMKLLNASHTGSPSDKGTDQIWQELSTIGKRLLNEKKGTNSLGLRVLQVFGSVQYRDERLIHSALRSIRHNTLKTKDHLFILQALARLRMSTDHIDNILRRCSLCWPTLISKHLVKTANAVAKLDRSREDQWTKPLSKTLSEAITSGKVTGKELANVKALTAVRLLDDFALIDFFVSAARQPEVFEEYPNHLMITELFIRLDKGEEVWKHVPEEAKEFLKAVRTRSRFYDKEESVGPGGQSQGLGGFKEEVKKVLDGETRVIADQLCGPYQVDFFFPESNAILELAPEFQFYHKSQKLTATAKLRHQLLRAMGFKVVLLPHFDWVGSEQDKTSYITKCVLPALIDK